MLEVTGLSLSLPDYSRKPPFGAPPTIDILHGVDLSVSAGDAVGIVGESGSGKTTLGRTLIRLHRPTAGRIVFLDQDITDLREAALRPFRSQFQMIFQDPQSSLNPRHTVARIIAQPLRVYGRVKTATEARRLVDALLERVALRPVHGDRYPHELSGGQRQRVGIARALAVEPEFIICDEAVSALDVSIQAQVINLLEDLRERFDLTYLFISHDLSVVHHLCHRVAVMYLGHMVELAETEELFANPMHPYTQALLEAVPIPDPTVERARAHQIIKGEIPSPINPPPGCVFHPRCPKAVDGCKVNMPVLREVKPGHWVACTEV